MTKKLSHIDEQGQVRMVDVGEKPVVRREAVAECIFCAQSSTIDQLLTGNLPKGEALATARVAGIQAAKRCGELIPLCHPLPIDVTSIEFDRLDESRLRISATVLTSAKTGVEMEALAAVTIAALTLYDMTKAVDKSLSIENVRLVRKTKG